MKKAQSEIVGTVLISTLILVVVGSTFVWGRPLIDKSSDKSKLDTILLKFEELDSAIRYVASTGSSKIVSINLHEEDQLEINEDGEIELQTVMKVPIITSKDFTPLNAYELPEDTALYYTEMNNTLDADSYQDLVVSLMSQNSEILNASLGIGNWNVLSYRRQSDDYNYVCVAEGTDFSDELSQCGVRGEDIFTSAGNYTVIRINDTGSPVYLSGGLVENLGLLGKDVPGIILGKSDLLGGNTGLITTIKMAYRGLLDDKRTVHRVNVACEINCIASSGVKDIRIVRTDVERNPDSIDTYINVEII